MARPTRILIEGGLYHVYNRFARGEHVFSDLDEAMEFVGRLRNVKRRDDLQVLAWSVLSNHFHLAVRTSAVPLSRTMGTLQGGFARAFNRRKGRSGPLWERRYHTRLVDGQLYLETLVCYIHLNPVRAGMVGDPAEYSFCGHREVLGEVNDPIVDIDDALLGFGPTTKVARRAYLKRVNAMLAYDERTEISERLPWWRPERELRPSTGRAYVDVLGRSTGLERERLEVREFLELACAGLGIPCEGLIGPRKDRVTTRRRELVATVGIERWEQRAAEIGSLLGKHPDVVSRWARAGANLRWADPQFARAIDELDMFLSQSVQR